MKKSKIFFFHFNKPASRAAKSPKISLHFEDKCHIIDNIVLNVSTYGKVNKRQPVFVVKGKASKIDIIDGVAHVS